MADTFWLKRGDTLPVLVVTLHDPIPEGETVGPAHDLTAASGVKLHIRRLDGGSTVVTRDMVIDPDPTTGIVRYAWAAADWSSLNTGRHSMEYEVLGAAGARLSFPNDGDDVLDVKPDIGQG